jgi:hypothetical protein
LTSASKATRQRQPERQQYQRNVGVGGADHGSDNTSPASARAFQFSIAVWCATSVADNLQQLCDCKTKSISDYCEQQLHFIRRRPQHHPCGSSSRLSFCVQQQPLWRRASDSDNIFGFSFQRALCSISSSSVSGSNSICVTALASNFSISVTHRSFCATA